MFALFCLIVSLFFFLSIHRIDFFLLRLELGFNNVKLAKGFLVKSDPKLIECVVCFFLRRTGVCVNHDEVNPCKGDQTDILKGASSCPPPQV